MEKAAMEGEAELLRDELDRLRKQVAKLEAALAEVPDYGLGEGDPAIVRWELDRVLLEQTRARVASVAQALSRLSQGVYGMCERCGGPIHLDRLAVLPDTRLCIRCARDGVSDRGGR